MQSTDDGALLRQYVEDESDEAFAALVTRHINLVYSVALRQAGNPQHAEEITQVVFIILAKKAAKLRHDRALSSWLFQATHMTANNFVRSEIRRRRREQESHMRSELNESGSNIWERIVPLLDSAVAGLKEEDRRAILLRFYEGRNLREVGDALGTSEEAAKKRVKRAVEKLEKFFLKRGIASTTAAITAAISANSVHAAPAALAQSVSAVATSQGAAASTSVATLLKGALKIMAWTKAKTAIAVGAGTFLALGAAAVAVSKHHEASNQKEAMMQQTGAIKTSVFPAIIKFAQAHQDEIPRSMADLKPYLPAKVDGIDDNHWRIYAKGKLTPLLTQGDVILLEQEKVSPGKTKIIVYTDGHVEWK